jgi:hypothetical protein
MNSKIKKIIPFFFEKLSPYSVSRWYHGYCYYDCRRDKYVTCLLPFNLIIALARSFHYMISSAGYGAEQFFRIQKELRSKDKSKSTKSYWE